MPAWEFDKAGETGMIPWNKSLAAEPIATYSKCMGQRLALAQALVNDPQLLVLTATQRVYALELPAVGAASGEIEVYQPRR